MAVLLETTLGDVVIDLYTEERPRGEARPCPAAFSPGRAASLSPPPASRAGPAATLEAFWASRPPSTAAECVCLCV